MKKYLCIYLWLLFPGWTYAQGLGTALLDEIHLKRNVAWDQPMHWISESAYPVSLALPLVQCIYGLASKDPERLRESLQTTGALVITAGGVYALKYTLQRKRPYMEHSRYQPYEWAPSPSFPSGHTALAFSTATSLSLEYRKWYITVPAFLWAGGVGYSRMHLGAHYPGDVLMGILTGCGGAYLSYYLNGWLQKRGHRKAQKNIPVGL